MKRMDAAEVARLLADALERAGIPHAIGGAISLGYWAEPRGTHDVDINLFLEPDQSGPALDALVEAGLDIDRNEAIASGRERGDARGFLQGMRVDIFFNSIPLHGAAAKRLRFVPLRGRPIAILSPEDLSVLKLLFNRPKDWLDVEKILATQGPQLDRTYVRHWLVDAVGEEDQRVARWDALCSALPESGPPPP
jgi:hypothetical protein